MSQRLKVMEIVTHMHEKDLVLMNILRDIAENETSRQFAADASEEEIARCVRDQAARQAEIFAEIRHVLLQEDVAGGVRVVSA